MKQLSQLYFVSSLKPKKRLVALKISALGIVTKTLYSSSPGMGCLLL